MNRKYKIGFDIYGLALFFIIMLPNFIWFSVSAPNDILRQESITPILDTVASISQILMVAVLCLVLNRNEKQRKVNPFIIAAIISCAFYFTAWVIYYQGIANGPVILSLCIFPCLAFVLYEIDQKNWIAMIPTVIFTVCHLIFGIVNFII